MAVARCDHCGAPLELVAGSAVVRCAFCKRDQVIAGLPIGADPPVHTAVESYRAGEPVLCEWRGRYWPAQVVEVVPGGQYRIHYDGYSASWDETVGVDRLEPRPKTSAPRPAPFAATGHGAPQQSAPTRRGPLVFALLTVIVAIGAVTAVVAKRATQALDPGAPPPAESPAYPRTGAFVPAAAGQLAVGQPVLVSWNGRWWNATVVSVRDDGRVRIHYTGWSSSWDEDVTLDRVRLP